MSRNRDSDPMTSAERTSVPLSATPGVAPSDGAGVCSDLWDRNGNEARDWAGCGEEEK